MPMIIDINMCAIASSKLASRATPSPTLQNKQCRLHENWQQPLRSNVTHTSDGLQELITHLGNCHLIIQISCIQQKYFAYQSVFAPLSKLNNPQCHFLLIRLSHWLTIDIRPICPRKYAYFTLETNVSAI